MSRSIPQFVVEYFLLGRTRDDALNRYTQDGGIVADVWLAYASNLEAPQRVLVAPASGATSVDLAYALNLAINAYREQLPKPRTILRAKGGKVSKRTAASQERVLPSVAPLESFVAVTLYLDELLRIVLPLTRWWKEKNLAALHRKAAPGESALPAMLRQAICIQLGHGRDVGGSVGSLRPKASGEPNSYPNWRVIEASSIAALIGVYRVAQVDPGLFEGLSPEPRRRSPEDEKAFVGWVYDHASRLAKAATDELARPIEPTLLQLREELNLPRVERDNDERVPPALIQRVFLDRKARPADADGLCAIKADAAERLFDISCRDITWAVIDSGIASAHPAFRDHGARDRRGRPIEPRPSRVRATYDFTLIDRIRNFDLATATGAERSRRIGETVRDLLVPQGRQPPADFEKLARTNLELIAGQLARRVLPDWSLIEPLIRLSGESDGLELTSDHGTHVAGILAGDWREEAGEAAMRPGDRILRGVCPDINLYDLRVIHPRDRVSTEFAVLAALEFVQFLNSRAAVKETVIHGVNISMSIPHDVRNYACGATPVCVACDRLVHSGVVVVAAAGNRGWNEQEIGFGNFVFCSITDPGNAQQVLTVGSTHRLQPHTFGVSYFSSRGPTGDGRVKPDLVAPGEKIRGPIRGDADDQFDGTSMAAPFVSGAAAMLLARHRELIGDAMRVKRVLCQSATDLGREKYFQGCGMVDVLRALQSI